MNCWNCLTAFLSHILQQERIKVIDMMESIAQASMGLSAAQFSVEYSTSVTKMAMDTQELAADTIAKMMPPSPGMGKYIDTYA